MDASEREIELDAIEIDGTEATLEIIDGEALIEVLGKLIEERVIDVDSRVNEVGIMVVKDVGRVMEVGTIVVKDVGKVTDVEIEDGDWIAEGACGLVEGETAGADV